MAAQPIFILSSGRSGTYSFYNALRDLSNIEIYHEFLFDETLRNSVSYEMKIISKKKILSYLDKSHSFSINNSKKKIWIDSSNALPWIIQPLKEKFKKAKFIFLIRNGRKVVSSFYNKFNEIMYNKKDVLLLKRYVDKKIKHLSSEKKYWRPIPTKNKEFSNYLKQDQFTKICIYWSHINSTIRKNLTSVKNMNKMFFKLENLNDKRELTKVLKFIGVKGKDLQKVFKKFERPVNVRKPKNFKLSNKQEKIFRKICGKEMIKNGYNYDDFYNIGY